MTALVAFLTLVLGIAQVDQQDKKRIPEDSVELTVIGCINGRVLNTIVPREADVQRGPNVGERTFRLNGKREVMDEVKKRNRQLVEVVGIVRRAALDDKGAKSGRVSVSGGSPVAGGPGMSTGVDNVPVMDVSSVRVRGTSCDEK